MRPYLFFLAIAIAVLFFSCRDKCRYVDCAPDDNYGQFRIVSASSGKDLLFGPNKIYSKDQIKFYSLKNIDTIFFDSRPGVWDISNDSSLLVHFWPKSDTVYMKLGNGDIDTLTITYDILSSECCKNGQYITNFRYNNLVDFPGNIRPQVLKK